MTLEKRILVVDDDDTIRALLRTVLRRRGFIVDVARNGVEAIERISLCRYSLIILDLMMPLMSGYEVLERLGDESAARRPRVLLLTAGLEPRVTNTDFLVGTIHKPFDLDLLLDTVTGYLKAVEGFAQPEECPPAKDSESPSTRPN